MKAEVVENSFKTKPSSKKGSGKAGVYSPSSNSYHYDDEGDDNGGERSGSAANMKKKSREEDEDDDDEEDEESIMKQLELELKNEVVIPTAMQFVKKVPIMPYGVLGTRLLVSGKVEVVNVTGEKVVKNDDNEDEDENEDETKSAVKDPNKVHGGCCVVDPAGLPYIRNG
jgi:hypothetical protein